MAPSETRLPMSYDRKKYIERIWLSVTIYIVVVGAVAVAAVVFGLIDWAFGSGTGVSQDYFSYSLLVICFVIVMFIVMRVLKPFLFWWVSRSEKKE
jgi:preprotein translocase subunit SecE